MLKFLSELPALKRFPLVLLILRLFLAQNFSEHCHLGGQLLLTLISGMFSWKQFPTLLLLFSNWLSAAVLRIKYWVMQTILGGSRGQVFCVMTTQIWDYLVRFSHLKPRVWLFFIPLWSWQEFLHPILSSLHSLPPFLLLWLPISASLLNPSFFIAKQRCAWHFITMLFFRKQVVQSNLGWVAQLIWDACSSEVQFLKQKATVETSYGAS